MYNALFGVNNMCDIALSTLRLDKNMISRFRDACFGEHVKTNDTSTTKYYIEILTRTGGNNRNAYDMSMLTEHPWFVEDYDDEYDNTYAHFIFDIPDIYQLLLKFDMIMSDQERDHFDLEAMFSNAANDITTKGTRAYKLAHALAEKLNINIDETDEDNNTGLHG